MKLIESSWSSNQMILWSNLIDLFMVFMVEVFTKQVSLPYAKKKKWVSSISLCVL